ncbi:multiple RNA-binding domain-containing protein [Plectosphaerella plurivora]|uniref:Multiple RNA-binding domain-containing protein n=1 Tax=Plectosphaerella plurivora TaxID=936078 RepID=A0A9P8VDI3_9PEZI|nr:multiple RNA-binding domain-containing protein [Plectosphaerella plurivora]
MESSRIFIRGLPPNMTGDKAQAALRKHFSAGGREVTDVKVISDRRFGFVGFKTPEQANSAVRYFDRTFLKASRLSVSLAKPVEDPSAKKGWQEGEKKPSSGKAGSGIVVPKTDAAADATKKRKRGEVDEADPKLAEYLKTFEKGKSAANEVAEMLNPAALAEQEQLLKEAESDDEYESIPARPGKKQMRDAPTAEVPVVAPQGELPVATPAAEPEVAQESEEAPKDAEPATAQAALTDDDWLRSRTNRLLELVDDEEMPQRHAAPPPPVAAENREVDEPMEGQETVEADPSPAAETATEEAPAVEAEADVDASLATLRKTARIFIRNLAFTSGAALATQEEDLRAHFEQFGDIQEVHIPVAASGTSKGYALILFSDPEAAVAAFQSVGPGATFQGRLVHVLPASARRDEALDEFQLSQLPLAKQRVIRKKAEASKTFNWNSLYLSQDAVNTAVASRLGVSKADLLDVHDSSAAVKQAVAETSVIQETKEYFAVHGVDLDSFKSQKKSDDAILVKNIPVTTREELRTLFEQHGAVLQVLMPPSGTIAIVQYAQAAQGKTAFARLAYCRFKDSVLFLEKAPRDIFKNATLDPANAATGDRPAGVQKLSGTDLFDKDEEDQGETTSVFVKNLNFDTTNAGLSEVAKALEGYRGSTIKTKSDPKKPGQTLSLGYGFIAFNSREAANAGLAALNGYVLDGHTLQVKLSSKGYDAAEERRREDKAKKGSGQRSKLIVKNLGFEVSKKDLRALFSNYGQLRSCRIPQGMGGKSRGFGFVDFKTSREAENAFNALKDTHLLGRRLVVDWAEAELEDPEEQIKAMEAKVRGQTDKVTRAALTNRNRKKVQIGEEADVPYDD